MSREDEPLLYARVYRHLGDPVYRLRWYFIRLTDGDLFLMMLSTYIVWSVIHLSGAGERWVWSQALTLDPVGWLMWMALAAVSVSMLHRIRPEGDIEEIVRGLGLPKLYAPGGEDAQWTPGAGRTRRAEVRGMKRC